MNANTLVTAHGYEGDAPQIRMLLPVMEHHECPLYIVSPEDSPIESMGPHSCLFAGERAYTGHKSWVRQYLQMKRLLDFNFNWYFLNDSDSFCITPELPSYLYEDDNTIYGNVVNDFRIPGETWTDKNGSVTWPMDYHKGFPLLANQPPYFLSRKAMQKMVDFGIPFAEDPITPFIDWLMLMWPIAAGVAVKPFLTGVSCETQTDMGLQLVSNKVREGATFIHAVKRQHALDTILAAYRAIS